MYRSHYGLQSKPFQINSDPRFLWLGEKHQEALAVLKYGILDNRGFLQLTGDVGTGKTTLINALVNSLGPDTLVAHVPDPGLAEMDFFAFIANAFHISDRFTTKGEFLVVFRGFLERAYTQQKKVLLIVDEAQRLECAMLEEIRLLSNIELQQSKLINIFFVGQDEFNDILGRKENRALRQRMTLSYHIDPLTEEETRLFVRHRLKVAGTEKKIFSVPALYEVFAFSGGYPRLINIICDHALLTGYVKGEKIIDAPTIAECAKELQLSDTRDIPSDSKASEAPSAPEPTVVVGPASPPPSASGLSDSSGRRRISPSLLMLVLVPPVLITLLVLLMGNPSWESLRQGLDRLVYVVTGDSDRLEAARAVSSRVVAPPVPEGAKNVVKSVTISRDAHPPAKTSPPVPAPPVDSPAPQPEKTAVSAAPLPAEAGATPAGPVAVAPRAPLMKVPAPSTSVKVPARTDSAKLQARTAKVKAKAPSPEDREGSFKDIPPVSVVHFNINSNDLSPDSYHTLDRLAAYLMHRPSARLVIKGYTDSIGSEGYNLSLSRFRANIVKNYLLGHGIAAGRMVALGLGSKDPISSNDTSLGRNANRRVELRIRNP